MSPEMMQKPFISFADQAMYLAHTAGGQHAIIQLLWRYHRAVDLNALARFQDNLAHSSLGRLVRPALLPFGRHQWIDAATRSTALTVANKVLPPEAMMAWADTQVELPLDPTAGPGWTLTVQHLTDGSTVVSLVVSHCIADGMATALAVSEAARGHRRPTAYRSGAENGKLKTLLDETLRSLLDAPATLKALKSLIETIRNPLRSVKPPSPSSVSAISDERTVVFPSIFIRIPIGLLEQRTSDLGVRLFTLLAALTGAFAEELGRIRNNEASLLIPVNQRNRSSDIGANRVSLASLKVPVNELRGDLQRLQQRVQRMLKKSRHHPDPLAALLPLAPFIPKRAFAAARQMALSTLAELPVTCSHMGEFPKDVLNIDGDSTDRFCFRGVDRQVTVRAIEERLGVATLITGVMPGYILMNFIAYQPGTVTQSHHLRAVVQRLLDSYELSGEFFDA